jgi:ABC-2 type transport system ATP-binding protein
MIEASAIETSDSDTTGPAAISTERLVKRFGRHCALDGVSIEVAAGSAAGLVGANGAGKTTFIKCVLDLCAADQGGARIFGIDARQSTARAQLAYLPERFVPPHYLLGREFLAMTLSLAGTSYDPALAAAIANELELDPQALDRPARQLSKGMTQKLGLAACLLQERKLYVLDEPMSGLDPASRLAVKSLLACMIRGGKGLFFTSHVLSDVEELCSTIAVLDQGRVRFSGAPAQLRGRFGEDSLERAFLKCVRSDVDAPAISA